MSEQHFDYARVYLGPELDGGHPGYRGPIILCAYGVWVGEFAEWLFIQDDPTCLPDGLPWRRRC